MHDISSSNNNITAKANEKLKLLKIKEEKVLFKKCWVVKRVYGALVRVF